MTITFKTTRQLLLKGVNKLNKAVSTTLGPKGRNVVITTQHSAPIVTKDGITVAKFFKLSHPVQNAGVDIIKQASAKSARNAGDGTTTAVTIATAIANNADKLIQAGYDPMTIKEANEQVLLVVLELLRNSALPIDGDKIRSVATISANNDATLGDLIAQAFEHVGKEGVITLEESATTSTYIDQVDGYTFDRGYMSPHFITDTKKQETTFEDAIILVTDKKIRSTQELLPTLEHAVRTKKPLVIIADDFDPQVLQLLIVNNVRGHIQAVAIKAPSYGEMRQDLLSDIALFTSAELISEAKAQRLEDTLPSQYGKATKIIVSSESTTILASPAKDIIDQRVNEINIKAEGASTYFETRHANRISNLLAKVARIHVGAPTESEMEERKSRLDDAIRATKAAALSGVVIGGGTALARVADSLLRSTDDSSPIIKAYLSSLSSPLKTIAENAGMNGEVVLDAVLRLNNFNYGFNAKTMEYTDLSSQGVYDPLLVTEQALINATSAANMIILSECAIANDTNQPASPYDAE